MLEIKQRKIKTFQFEVCNISTGIEDASTSMINTHAFETAANNLTQPSDIDIVINDFIKDKDIIDINITVINQKYRQRNYNTIILWYTIQYYEMADPE